VKRASFAGHVLCGIIVLGLAGPPSAQAVPSFARQTNMACSACHSRFPELTSFGRAFKLNGYTLIGAETVEAADKKDNPALKLLKAPPVSFMLQASHTHLARALEGTENNSVDFPQQLSVFVAGEIAPRLGAFIQVTYDDQAGALGWDNADLRYAASRRPRGKDLTWGLTLNNNPTVQDVWNSTPTWSFPYAASGSAPVPAEATLVEGGLAQKVAGLGGYILWNNLVYGELTFYRSAQQGGTHPPDSTTADVVRGGAPYWRLALQKQQGKHYLQVGAYGLKAQLYPTGTSGDTDRYADIGVDAQYEFARGGDLFSLHSTFIHEKQTLDATFGTDGSENRSLNLRTFKIDGNYYFAERYGVSLACVSVGGDGDAVLYGGISRTGLPDSRGSILEFQYLPWMNTKLSVQYVHYTRFNGSSRNYDGAGRNAGDNNTLYSLFWVAF
jgi:hypothetical protein